MTLPAPHSAKLAPARPATWVLLALVAAGLLWWQRAAVAPFLAGYVPGASWIFGEAPSDQAGGERANARRRGGGGAAPVPVVLGKAEAKALPVTIEAIGTIEAAASIQIRPRVDGQIVKVHVGEGARAAKDDVLFTLDDQVIRAQLAGIEATIAKDNAQIEQAERDFRRASELLTSRAGSPVQRETAATAVKMARAQLAADEAQRKALEAALSYTVIRAPVSGRVGVIPIKPGSLVRAGEATALATINQVDPAMVSFAIPQTRLDEVRAAMARGPVRVDVTSGAAKASGAIIFIDNAIDPASGTILIKAQLPNAQESFWPGAFATAAIILDPPGQEVTVPVAALQVGQRGSFVFVAKAGAPDKNGEAGMVVELRPITVSRTSGADAVVAQGLAAGETVVVEGQLRLVDGAAVTPRAAKAGHDEARPHAPRPES